MSGGKGGSQTTKVEVPQYIEDAAKANLARADEISRIGYTPYYGPDVAAFSPMQQASFQNTADTASAFGLAAPTSQQDIMGGMPAPTTYAGGVSGYSAAPMYEQSLAELQAQRPAQYAAIMDQFIDPYTGTAPSAASLAPASTAAAGSGGGGGGEGRDAGYDSYGGGTGAGGGVGYTGVRDMFDGGGPNASTIGGRDFAGPNPDGSAGNDGPGGGGCVVATHAVESGAFTPHMKREAVVWCMQALHGKWWGEAVRRGYRHLGRKKIEQGKAREHYAEFSRYIQFANGKKRDIRGAVTFALRTAQFFAVGLVKKDA